MGPPGGRNQAAKNARTHRKRKGARSMAWFPTAGEEMRPIIEKLRGRPSAPLQRARRQRPGPPPLQRPTPTKSSKARQETPGRPAHLSPAGRPQCHQQPPEASGCR
ncbi:hypothetical protein NDU88_000040 [Pleurodeles waltl]|uniref:Uncharacterized protein n=1 Tax=Pleurodeles waltl TaxID=8319 RepID=A0AAV7TDZ1_PLEWA|nr:hypothetical protein NDU88_000040 [Pleurodeles waltl]